ncbi:MAG: glycosyl hydrolase family 28-related protein [Streptomyces sp.]|uniref:glycosyl hydrolase family 28-related protein n=1 Tax=Streptomyces sp. TaxID=1931 RepID=UPI003D6B8444
MARTAVTRRTLLTSGAAAVAALGVTSCTAGSGGESGEDDAKGIRSGGRPAGKSVVDVVADFGARGDGRSDDSEAFEKAYRHAAARVTGGVGRTVIAVPPGAYLIRRPRALLDGGDPDRRANGLRFMGAGKRISEIIFQPDKDGAADAFLCHNDNMWANLKFEQLRFRSATPGASFFSSYSEGQAQDYRFSECEWTGEWTYGLALDGSNTNSEMRWDACRVGGAYRKAFLYSGLSKRSRDKKQQDQFLNYWFSDMKVEYEWGNFLEFLYGGSITCRGGSYIVTGRRPGPAGDYGRTSTFFRFPRAEHADSVQRFHAEDIRFEVRDPDVRIIDCTWDAGTVHFNDCDDTSNAFKSFSAGISPHRYRTGANGPMIRYDMCSLVGHHRYETGTRKPGAPPLARYDMCAFRSHPQRDFAEIRGSGAGDKGAEVRFTDCTGH